MASSPCAQHAPAAHSPPCTPLSELRLGETCRAPWERASAARLVFLQPRRSVRMPSTWFPRSLSNMECSRCLSTELAPVARGRREGAQWRNTSPPPLNNKSPTDPTRNNNTSHAALAERKGAPQHPSRPSENPSQVPTRSGPKLQPNIPGRSMSTAWPRARDRDAKALSLTQNPIVAVASPRRGSRGARPTHTTRQPPRLSSPPKPWCIPSRHGAARKRLSGSQKVP